jgi:thiol-disulfide isomerase/thioredoxin
MLPQLLPHKDKEYLLAFGSDNCDHCDQMEPVLKRLEEDLGNHIFYSI